MIEIITSQAIAFSFPIKPNFSTVLPFRLIWFSFKLVSFDIELIILSRYFETLGCSQIKFISRLFIEILNNNDFYINNLDINLICEQPKVSKFRDKIIKSLSNLLNIDKELINLKGKTVEKLGLIGKEKAIACEVICSITQWKK